MILRRRNLIAIGTGIALAPFLAIAQQSQRVYRVGCLFLRSSPSYVDEAFRRAMRELGYVEGQNLSIEYRWVGGDEGRLPQFAADLVRLNVDVILTSGYAPIKAAKEATGSIPIVMAAVSEAVSTGLVSGLANPGGNVTGLTLMTADLAPKRIELMSELIPKIKRVALLITSTAPSWVQIVEHTRTASKQRGIQLIVQKNTQVEDLSKSFATLRQQGAQGVIVPSSPFVGNNTKRLVELAAEHKLPAIFENPRHVELGGLISYGPDSAELYRRAAYYVDRILKGARPADLPVEQPTRFELVINRKTAKALGLTIPRELLLRANRVIE